MSCLGSSQIFLMNNCDERLQIRKVNCTIATDWSFRYTFYLGIISGLQKRCRDATESPQPLPRLHELASPRAHSCRDSRELRSVTVHGRLGKELLPPQAPAPGSTHIGPSRLPSRRWPVTVSQVCLVFHALDSFDSFSLRGLP